MNRQVVTSSFGLVILGSLAGCIAETPGSPQALVVRTPGNHWNDCLEAIELGVAGDGCQFDPEEIGTAVSPFRQDSFEHGIRGCRARTS